MRSMIEDIIEAHGIDLADPSRYGSNILHKIASYPSSVSRNSALSLAAPYRPDFKARDRNGWTPLLKMLAAEYSWDKWMFFWLIDNCADVSEPVSGGPSTRLEDGITCIHLVVAALYPISLSSAELSHVGPDHPCAIASIPAQTDTIEWGPPAGCGGKWNDQSQWQVQMWFLKVLIEKRVDLHAVARHWGTPTDIARYTGNTDFWYRILEEGKINVKNFLDYDSTI